RINIAARAVGVAQAAYDDTVAHLAATSADAPPAVADMATKLRAARLLTSWAAAMKDRGERCDLEAGMAKLFASESAQEVAVEALAELGILGALVDPGHGGLGLDLRTTVMIVEELARGSATLAAILVAHLTATHAIARFGTAEQRERLLPAMARGEILGTVAFTDGIRATRTNDGWILDGETPPVDHAAHAAAVLVPAVSADDVALFVVGPGMPGFSADRPEATLGLRGLESGRLRFEGCRVAAQNRLDGAAGRALEQRAAVLEVARLGAAATGVGLAQAAFEAALRYLQQRTTFGKP